MKFAPIAIFIFNRPEHIRKTLEHLVKCPEFEESPVFIYCDGPRDPRDELQVAAARLVARSVLGDRGTIIERHTNRGIANSIIAGVTELCERYGRVIVLEDDLAVDPSFLQFMNVALNQYETDPHVMQISGHAFNVPEFSHHRSAVVLPFITSWGWATWQRAWARFDAACIGWERLKEDRSFRRRFNLDGAFDYYWLLRLQFQGRSDAWDIRWYWAVFRDGGIVVYPPRTLVRNNGFDGSGTHGWRSARRALGAQELNAEGREPISLPTHPHVDDGDYRVVKEAIRKLGGGNIRKAARWIARSL